MNDGLCICPEGSCDCQTGAGSTPAVLDQLSSLLKVVGDNNRLKAIYILKDGRKCVCELMAKMGLSQSLTSHHLADLKKAGLVRGKKESLRVYYFLTDQGKKVAKLIFKIINI